MFKSPYYSKNILDKYKNNANFFYLVIFEVFLKLFKTYFIFGKFKHEFFIMGITESRLKPNKVNDYTPVNNSHEYDIRETLPKERSFTIHTSAKPEVRGTADVGWRSLIPLPFNPPRTHSRLYHHMCTRTNGQ